MLKVRKRLLFNYCFYLLKPLLQPTNTTKTPLNVKILSILSILMAFKRRFQKYFAY